MITLINIVLGFTVSLQTKLMESVMNKDSWVALTIASIITIIVSTQLYYSQDYSHGVKGKLSEGSDTKVSESINRTDKISESTTK